MCCFVKVVGIEGTHIFDIGARGNGNHIAVLHSEVVTDDSVDSSTSLIELLVGKDDEHCLLSLLASYEDGVAAEELEGVHGSLGQGNDAVVIVDGIGNPGFSLVCGFVLFVRDEHLHQLVGLLLLLEDGSGGVIFL
jgi:hypothetical protein